MKELSQHKYIQYYPNGSGRDSYINSNSGGFSQFMIKTGPSTLTLSNNVYHNFRTQRDLSKKSWTFQYQSDGSGRDSYILSGSGGLQREYHVPKSFKDQLRSVYLPNTPINHAVRFSNNIRYISKDEFRMITKLKKIQDNVTSRLYSIPEKTELNQLKASRSYSKFEFQSKNLSLNTQTKFEKLANRTDTLPPLLKSPSKVVIMRKVGV